MTSPSTLAPVSARRYAPLRCFVLASVSATALLLSAQAHAEDKGTLQGKVTTTNNAPLAGAVVKIEKTPLKATTASDGSFSITGVPAGSYHVEVEDAAEHKGEADVTIVAGKTTDQKITAVEETKTIVVFGARNPQSQARVNQRDAPNLVNLQAAEEIEKYPDVSTAEALSRIPGISIETDTAEGRFVNIRGLDSDLNGYTFGGVPLPASSPASPFSGGRAVAFDAIPAGFVGSLQVTKSLTPDMDATGLGGQIEVTPKTVRPGDPFFIEGQLGSGVEPLRSTPIVQGQLTTGAAFGFGKDQGPFSYGADKPFSILATAENYFDQRGIDDVEEAYTDQQAGGIPDKVYNSLELRRYTYHRQRYGYGGEFAWQVNPDSRMYVRYAESGYTEDVNRQRLVYNNLDNSDGVTDPFGNPYPVFQLNPSDPTGFIAPAAVLQTTLRDEVETLKDRIVSWGGETAFGDVKIDFHGAFTEGTYDKGHDYNSTFTSQQVQVAYNNTASPDRPTAKVLTAGFDQTNPNNYNFSGFRNQSENDRDKEWSAAVNVLFPLDLFSGEGKFKTGGGLRLKDRSKDQFNQSYTLSAAAQALTLANLDFGGQQNTYYDTPYTLPNQPNAKAIRNLLSVPGLLTEKTANDLASNQAAYERDSENVYAQYLQYSWKAGPFGVLAGIRFEETDATYGAFRNTTDALGNTTSAFGNNIVNYFNYFPTVQGRYEFLPNELIGRLSYSTAIARPGFNQISGSSSVDIGNQIVSGGNPNLRPETVDNFDASIEWYTDHAGIVSFGLFDKELHDYIFASKTKGTLAAYPGLLFSFNNFHNISDAQAYGAELNYHQKFTALPEGFDGLGMDLNYTYVSSQGEIRPGEFQALPSTSQHTANGSIFYEKYGVEARLSYSYVSQSLWAVGGSRATDVVAASRGVMDFAGQYQFTDNFKYYFNVKNLLDTPLRFNEGTSDFRPIQREFYDVSIQTGLKFEF